MKDTFIKQLIRVILKLNSWIILILSNVFLFLFFKDILNGGNSYHLHILTYCVMLMACHFIRYTFINRY